MSRQGQGPRLPDQNGRDEEEASSQEEGEALHEVQSGWVEQVEDAGGRQHGQAIHTGHSRKESTWEGSRPHFRVGKTQGQTRAVPPLPPQLDDLGRDNWPPFPVPPTLCCGKDSMKLYMGSARQTGY